MPLSKAPIRDILHDLMDEVGLETITGRTADFIRSVSDHFGRQGSVSEDQERVAREIHLRHFT